MKSRLLVFLLVGLEVRISLGYIDYLFLCITAVNTLTYEKFLLYLLTRAKT
jgi:hypothetical protein